jgi:hypothetical protein
MDSILISSKFDFETPLKRKVPEKLPKTKDIEINEKDTTDEKVTKILAHMKLLKKDIDDLRFHVEGTYCPMTVHDRQNDDVAKRIEELEKAY